MTPLEKVQQKEHQRLRNLVSSVRPTGVLNRKVLSETGETTLQEIELSLKCWMNKALHYIDEQYGISSNNTSSEDEKKQWQTEKKQHNISVEDWFHKQSILIVCAPTGIEWSAQCGGIGCTGPSAEGFALPMGDLLYSFEFCSRGCAWISQQTNVQKQLALDLNIELKEATANAPLMLSFDFDKTNELEEAWIPVVIIDIAGKIGSKRAIHKGYLHTKNCD